MSHRRISSPQRNKSGNDRSTDALQILGERNQLTLIQEEIPQQHSSGLLSFSTKTFGRQLPQSPVEALLGAPMKDDMEAHMRHRRSAPRPANRR